MFRRRIGAMAATTPFGEDMDAARRFATGFLERCIRDALLDFNPKSNVRAWLAGADCVFPFRLVCEFLEMDETCLRQQIEKLIMKPTRQQVGFFSQSLAHNHDFRASLPGSRPKRAHRRDRAN